MKSTVPPNIESGRITSGIMKSDSSYGMNGGFFIQSWVKGKPRVLKLVVSNQEGWDHVSVSLPNRTPTWEEMCFIKELFFEPEETVIQYHPPESKYINDSQYVLHLWRSQKDPLKLPPIWMV